MNQNNIYAMIGMAMKSGNVVSGEFACENAVKSMKAHLVIVPEDASFNTKKLFSNKTTFCPSSSFLVLSAMMYSKV